MKLLKKREKKSAEDSRRRRVARNTRLSLTGARLPGNASELVRSGPSTEPF